jgi:hypothetical protein
MLSIDGIRRCKIKPCVRRSSSEVRRLGPNTAGAWLSKENGIFRSLLLIQEYSARRTSSGHVPRFENESMKRGTLSYFQLNTIYQTSTCCSLNHWEATEML